ncbi:hypothetical protein [Ramlibacter sp.]|uniref:hypothetical protein n=1 Tax=Ramlibacter sp. TaxID=1917967 RepID=UPI00180F94AF|nr:hypothetical protein [Ramlibacter sp.]MBA2674466.1 hypothetical protein [Ramlibacter sp.]
MNRCLRWALLALSLLCAGIAQAQTIVRSVPADVKPGVLAVQNMNGTITVDGKPDRFTPGVRVHDINNMLVLSGSLIGRSVYTVYRRESTTGQVHEVWLLTPQEYRQVGGVNTGDADGYKRFAELLNLIFTARAMGAVK